MAFYRSELEVPVNKTTSELRHDIDFSDTRRKSSTGTSPTLDNWCERVKFNIHNDKEFISSIHDSLLHDQIDQGYLSSASNGVECLSPVNMFRQLQSKIAKGDDGNMHFTARFDVNDVNPDSIKVLVKEGSLIISVEQERILHQTISTVREYTRKFNLPPKIIIDSIKCVLSPDNILSLDGALENSLDRRSSSTMSVSTSSNHVSPSTISNASSCFFDSMREDKYRINVNVGIGYDPQDINIKTRDDKLFINARHEEKCETRTNYREFSKELTLPERVDSLSLSAIFNHGILYIEAPYVDR